MASSAPGLKADVNVIDFDRLRLHVPDLRCDLPAGGHRLVHTFGPCDPVDLVRAVNRALATPPDVGAARALAASRAWDQVFRAELSDLRRVVRAAA